MKCGQGIHVKDFYGAYAVRFIALCEGRFMQISNSMDYHNGYLLQDWRWVLRVLVGLTVPDKLVEQRRQVEGMAANGLFVGFPLTYPLPVRSLADLLGVSADEVRGELADLAVQHEV